MERVYLQRKEFIWCLHRRQKQGCKRDKGLGNKLGGIEGLISCIRLSRENKILFLFFNLISTSENIILILSKL